MSNNSFSDKVKAKDNEKPSRIGEIMGSSPKETTPQRTQMNIKIKEKRTKQKNVLLTPTLDKEVTKICNEMGISFNELVNQLLENMTNN